MKRFLRNLFTASLIFSALTGWAQAPTFSSAVATTTTNIRVTFGGTGGNLTSATFGGFTITGVTVTAASIVGGAGNSKQVDLTVNTIAADFTCSNCVAIAAGTVTDGVTANGAIAAAGNNVTDGIAPSITAVSIPNTPMKVGDVVTATITVATDPGTYTLNASTIGGFTLGSLNKSNNTTYTATFTVTNGGTDVAAGSNIPVSVQVQDASSNVSNTFTTAIAQAGDPIDANNPTFTSVTASPGSGTAKIGDNVQVNFSAGGGEATLVAGTTLTVNGVDVSGSFTNLGGGNYRVTYNVGSGNPDRASGTLPISLQIKDAAGNTTTIAAFTSANTLVIDANAPSFTSVTANPSTGTAKIGDNIQVNFTATGSEATLVAGATLTVNGVNVAGSFTNLTGGNYRVTYTVASGNTDQAAGALPISLQINDAAGNSTTISAFTAANTLAVDANAPSITAVSIPNVAMKVGDVVTATITVASDVDTYTLGASNINGFALGGLAKSNNTTYTATFTVTNGGTDRTAGANIPISVILNDGGGNPSNTFTTAIAQGSDPIDANNPSFTSVLPNPNTGFRKIGDQVQVNLTATGSEATLVAGATMTVNGVNVAGTFTNLGSGNYRVTYTVGSGDTDRASGTLPISLQFNDAAGNTATVAAFTAANTLVIDANAPVITAVSIPNVAMKVGDVVTATITVNSDPATYTLGASTIDGFTLGGLVRVNSTTYTATFTVANGGVDVAAGANIPISVILNDPAGNPSNTFTTAIAQASDPIDANRPVITAVSIPNVSMKVGDVVTATITVNSDVDTYTLPGGSTIGGFALGGLAKSNNTTYTATFTITNGGTDVAAGSNIPITVTLQDTGGNNNSPAFTTAIAQASDPIDANNPAAFTVGAVVTTGGTVRAGYWNSTNSGVNVSVPIANDASLNSPGAVQLQGKVSTDVTWTNVGASSAIGAINTTKTMALTAVQFEGIPNFGENVTVQIRAIITDAAGNATTGTQSATTLFVDQVAPTILGSPRLFLNATGVGGGTTGSKEVILLQTTEPMALVPSATPLTGTITCASNNATVTGSGTLFTTELAVGMSLFKAEVSVSPAGTYHRYLGVIASIASNTSLTLSANADIAVASANAFTRGLPVPDFDNNSNTGFNVDDANNDGQMTSKKAHYFSTYTPPYANPSTFTNVVRITSKDDNSNWSAPSTQVSYTAAGAAAFRDIAGNEFTLAATATTSGSTSPPALSPNTMTLFPRSTNPEKIVFNLDSELGQQGQIDATGTIVASTGSTTVTGTGTDFVTELAVGQQLWDGNGLHFLGMISAIGSATSLTLTANSLYDLNGSAFASGPTSGTITTSTASSTVTGVGTLFTTDLVVGQDLYDLYGTTKIGTIQSITNNTTLVLTGNALVNLAASPYTPSIVGFTSNPSVPFSAIYYGKGTTNKIALIAQSNGALTVGTTISYTQAAGNAVGANGVELLDITNHAVVMETVAPVITNVTIPNVTMKVGDVVTATITTADDDGDDVTLTSGAINGFALGGLVNVNGTTKTATFTVAEGGTDVAAASNITFSTNLVITDSSVPTASAAYNTAIVQAGDKLDANSPKVVSINRITTPNNGAPSFGTSSATATFQVTFSEDIAAGSISAADFIARMKGIGQGTITASTASTTITGVGTSFTTQLVVGSEIWDRTGTTLVGIVNSIGSNTSLTLNANAAINLAGTPWSSPSIANLTGAVVGAPVAITGTSVWNVTVSTYTGQGVLGLDYVDNNDANAVLDLAGNGTITSLVNPDGDFAGQTYQIILPEPTTQVTGMTVTATALDNFSLKLDWTGTSTGATNYLIIAKGLTDLDAAGAYPGVADKTPVADDTNFADGQGAINIPAGVNTYTFTTLLSGKPYDFQIIPYALSPNNTSDNIDYFTTGAPFVNGTFSNTASASTLTAGSTSAPATISSLSTAFGAKNFTFTITDDGGTPAVDNARTRFTQLVISAGPGNTIPDWSQVIQEAELKTVTETTTTLVSGAAIGLSTITFPTSIADNAEGEVDDNEVKEYELRIRLKNPMGSTAAQNVDGQVFVFQVNNGSFTMVAAPSHSSQFGTGETEDSGSGTTVTVVASQFSFTAAGTVQPPAAAFVLTNLSATPIVRAVDANGNTDKNYVGAVTITNTGGLPMTSASLPIAAGVVSFPGTFQYTDDGVFAAGNGTLTVSDGTITNATSTSVTVSYSNTSTITAGPTAEPLVIPSTTTTSPGIQVFDFTINEDFGAAGDGSPTRISQIVLTQGTGNDVANWTQAIAGAILSDGTSSTPLSGTVTINPTNITISGIDITSLGLVPDSGTKTYRLSVWLNSAMGGTLPSTVDNMNLVFEVLQANITLTSLSSTIAGGQNQNSGSTNVGVQVITTQLKFTTSPAATLLPNKAVSLQLPIPVVEALDVNNNRDLDYNSTTIAVSNAGSIPMSNAPAANSLTAGILTFSGSFQYNNVGNGTLTVSTTTVNAAAGIPTSAVSSAVSVQAGSATTLTAGSSGSATIASTVNTVGAAVPVFNFTVNDDPGGTPPAQDDGNPTLITQLVFTQHASNAIADWTQAIAGAVLTDGTFSTPASGTVTINPTNITISGITTVVAKSGTITSNTGSTTVTGVGTSFTTELAVGQVLYDAAGTTRVGTINSITNNTTLLLSANAAVALTGSSFSTANLGLTADNGTKTYTLRIYLKSSLGGTLPITIDGTAFGFEMLTSGITTTLNGTSVLPLQAQNSGLGNDVVSVVATKLSFVQLDALDNFAFPANAFPSAAFINTPFSPRLGMEAQDVNGNRDLGFTGTITAFTVNNGLGTSNNPSGAFTAGTLKFPSTVPASSFVYTSGNNQDGALTVTAGGVTSTSPAINVSSSQDAYVYFDDTGYTPLINSATQQAASLPATADATIATLAKLILSDGGAANFEATGNNSVTTDTDGAFTRISQISFAITNSSDLRTLALYNNAGTKISSDVAAGPTVNFTGLNIQAADNSTVDFTVRTTFNSTIGADHDLVQLTITGVTQSAGSLLYQGPTPPNAAYKGGVLNGDVTLPTANKIDVVATKLVFTQNPPAFAGLNEPVPYSGTPATTVVARDANNNLDVDFDFATQGTKGDISSIAPLVTNSFPFAAGVMDLGSIQYNGTGNGTLTVSVTTGLPYVIFGTPGPVIASPSNGVSTTVDVVHVTTSIATGGIIPGPTANIAGGAVDRKIFGVTFTAPYQAGGNPDLNSFIITFGLPPGPSQPNIDDILTNFRVYENTSGTFGGPNISSFSGTVTPVRVPGAALTEPNQALKINFPVARDLNVPKSYFLEVDVVPTASGSTPPIQPQVIDLAYGSTSEHSVVTTQGSVFSSVSGNVYNFSAIFPPSLEASYPAKGQLNIATNQPKISLNFSVPVWTLDEKVYLIDQVDGDTLVLTADNGRYSLSSGGTVNNRTNPVIFSIPAALDPDHVYYFYIKPGVFNGPAATNNTGFMDEAGNLFAGISYSGTLYFKTVSPNTPNLLATPTAPANPSASGTVVGGTVSATFDQSGTAYYLILPNGTATPTPDQIIGLAPHPSAVAKGNFAISQVSPIAQFGNFVPLVGLTASTTYDVWMSSTSTSEFSATGLKANAVITQVPAVSPAHYGNINKITKPGTITTSTSSATVTGIGTSFLALRPGRTLFDASGSNTIGVIASIASNTTLTLATNAQLAVAGTAYQVSGFEIGATGPTFTFVPTSSPASVQLSQPSLSICTGSFQVLNQPIIINESSAGNDFSGGGTQSFNLVLPAGFEFDISMSGLTPVYGTLTLVGTDFTGGGNPQLSFIGSSILKVSYLNSGSGSVDKIIISGLRVRANSSTSGSILRFGGNALTVAMPDLSAIATISSAVTTGVGFYNSYSIQTFNNTSVTTIPNNFDDKNINQALVAELIPSPPYGDYGPSTFSGPGVSVNLLSLTAVTLGVPFNISINHVDNNGCPSSSQEQYTVYDSRTAIADLSTEYCTPNDQFQIYNPLALATTGLQMSPVTYNRLQSYYLDGLSADIPVGVTDPDDATRASTDQIIFGQGWKNLLNRGQATGTINVSDLSTTVTGVGTLFTTEVKAGTELFDVTGKILLGVVKSVASNTSLTLTSNGLIIGGYGGNFTRSWLLQRTLYTPGSTVSGVLIGPEGGYLPLNNPLPGPPAHEYFDYILDRATLLNAKSMEPSIVRNPYDYFAQTSPQGNVYYSGGSLGIVQYTGTFQSIANASVRIPLIQNVRYFVPAVPIIETSPPSYLDITDPDNKPGPGNPGAPPAPPVGPGGSRSSNQGTPVFCELGGSIIINAFPAASPGSSTGRFKVVDHTTPTTVFYDKPPGGPNVDLGGFTDNTNGTASIDPTILGPLSANKDIRIIYYYQENTSPCASQTYQVIRISPNPIAGFTRSSTAGNYIVSTTPASITAAACATQPITFTSNASSSDPIDSSIKTYDWDFGDPTSSTNIDVGTNSTLAHTYATASPPGTPYTVTHKVVSFYGCPSVTAASLTTVTADTMKVNVGSIPQLNFSFTGVAKGEDFAFKSRSHDGLALTTTSANDRLTRYIWDFGDASTDIRDVADGLTTNAGFNADIVTHKYSTLGSKQLDLTVETARGCRNQLSLDVTAYRSLVVLDSLYLSNSSAVYYEQFNSTNGNWIAWGSGNNVPTMQAGITSSSWAYGTPANPFLPSYDTDYTAIRGTASWKTNIAGNYNAGEKSALYSPRLNISQLQRPMISFNTIVQTATSDGVVLQYSTDSLNIADPAKKWKTLGQIGDGEDWFTSNAIAGKPGFQAVDDYGWSGTNLQRWIEPKHTLDVLNASKRAVFRFAMGAAVGSSPQPGFWIDNVRVGDRTRTIMLESFANTGNANPTANEAFENQAVADFQDAGVGTEVIKVNYHVNFPGNDPFNQDNPADPSSRALFYHITSTPRSIMDGFVKYPNDPFSAWGTSEYNVRTLRLAQADLAINTSTNADGSLSIGVDVTSNVLTGLDSAILHVVVMEQLVNASSLPSTKQDMILTGETSFEYVAKAMLPSASGSSFGGPLAYLATRSFGPFTFRTDASRLYPNADDLAIAVFLQSVKAPYEIFQVSLKQPVNDPATVTGLEPVAAEQVLVYPNPANREVTVQLPGALTKPAVLNMVDQTGRSTLKTSMEEGTDRKTINVSDLSSGMYILTIDMGQGVLTRKKVIVVHQD